MGLFGFLKSLFNDTSDGVQDGMQKKALKDASSTGNPELDAKMARIRAEQEELDRLMNTYGGDKKSNQQKSTIQVKVGMSLSQVRKTQGMYDKSVENMSRGKKIVKVYYGEKKNRLGNKSYSYEITLKDDKVTGWKDLTNVGTRNK